MPAICLVLRRLREGAKLSQSALGVAIGRPQRWVSAAENGTEPPSRLVHLWAQACGATGVAAYSLAGYGPPEVVLPENAMTFDERLPEGLRQAMRTLYLAVVESSRGQPGAPSASVTSP